MSALGPLVTTPTGKAAHHTLAVSVNALVGAARSASGTLAELVAQHPGPTQDVRVHRFRTASHFLDTKRSSEDISAALSQLDKLEQAESFGREVAPGAADAAARVRAVAQETNNMAEQVAPMPRALVSKATPPSTPPAAPHPQSVERAPVGSIASTGRHAAIEDVGTEAASPRHTAALSLDDGWY